MSMNVSFYLGPAQNLATRALTIRRMYRAGDDSLPAAAYGPTDQGAATETVSHELPSNQIFQATLVDTVVGGGASATAVLNFHTGSLQFPGPTGNDRLAILSMEEMSSSSSSESSWSLTSSSSSSSNSSSSSSFSDTSLSSSSQSSSSSSSTSSASSSSQSSSSSESVTSSSSSTSSTSSASSSSE